MIASHAGMGRLAALQSMARGGNALMFDAYGEAEGGTLAEISARALIAKVRAAYAAGGVVLKIVPVDWQDFVRKSNPLIGLVSDDALVSPSKAAIAKNYRDLAQQIDRWADVYFAWAKAGRRDDGTAYSWARWGQYGRELLDTILYYSKMPVTDGFAANALQAAREFVGSVGQVFTPSVWPAWVKVAAFVAGAGVVAYAFRTFAPKRTA